MKLPINCLQCQNSQILAEVEFIDDGRYEFTCSKGHVSTTLLQQQKFEILFEIGAYAINDGYYREAISSFTSALERFYEFFIKVICVSKGNDWPEIVNTWKAIASQSERQLGAFILLYHLEHGKKPSLLSRSKNEFRNSVIHKGKIPTKQEAINYGQSVLDLVRPIIEDLRKSHSGSIQKTTFHHLNKTLTPKDFERNISTLGIKTILTLSFPKETESLEVALSKLHNSHSTLNTKY